MINDHFASRDKGIAVDATCGNGFDTEFLANLGFKKVIGFDIQEGAIKSTRARLGDTGLTKVELILDGHENLNQHVIAPIDCVMFNLGYLPSSDKAIATQANTSLAAVQTCLKLLSGHGLITLLCYPGFPQGAGETEVLENYLSKLNSAWTVDTHLASVPRPTAPVLFTIKPASAS